jgi:hypothetical protein
MALIIIGILVLIAGFIIQKNPQYGRFAKMIRGIALVIILAGILVKCIVQIEAGQVGVKSCLAKCRMMF